eukprot:scaffold10206_cov216-Ochromonas_danica.AAC.2
MTESQRLGRFAINIVVTHLRRTTAAKYRKLKTDSSLFRENCIVGDDFTKYIERYSSRFLGQVAGAVNLNIEADVIKQLYVQTPDRSTEAVIKDCLSKKRGQQGYRDDEPSTTCTKK